MKRVLIAIAAVWAVIAVGVMVVPRMGGMIDYRAALIDQIEARTGRKASIDGEVSLHLFPSTEFSAEGVRVASIPGAPSADVIRVRHALFKVDRWSLFSRKLRVTGIVLTEPKIYLDVLADGRRSWHFTPVTKPGKERKTLIDSFEARQATILYRRGEAQAMLTGDFAYDGSGPRPRLDASLKAGKIDADPFLPARDSGPEQVRKGGVRWSEAPLDLAALRSVDGKIAISADELRYRRYVFDKPAIKASLAGGQLTLESASAGLFGGKATVKGSIHARAVPAVKLDVSLTGASVEKALSDWADTPFANGDFALSGTFAAAGKSQYAMISSLNGTARIDAKGGIVRGFDAARLSDDLASLNRYSDFVDLADSVLKGGQTRYTAITGKLAIKNGIVDLGNVRAQLESARASADGFVDLPAWSIDTDVWLTLTSAAHAGTPAVGMTLTGPLEQPHQKNRLTDMGKFIGKKFVDTVIRDVLDDKAPAGDRAPPGERRAKAKRVFNSLVDRLDRRRGRDAAPRQYDSDSYEEPSAGYERYPEPEGYDDPPGGYDDYPPQGDGYRDYGEPGGRY